MSRHDGTAGRHRAGAAAIVATAALWGTTGTAATFAPGVGPLAIGAAALGIGGVLQAVVAVRDLRREGPAIRRRWRIVLVGALAVAVYPLAFYASMHFAGVAVGTVVSLASAPLASGVIDLLVERRRLDAGWSTAALLGVAGSAALCLPGGVGGTDLGATLAGIALGLVAGITYATYSWAARALMTCGVGRAASMGAVFGAGGLLLMPVLALTGAPILATPSGLAVAAYMALVPMFVGYLLFGFGLARVPASTATILTLFEPAVAAILAVAIVGERLTPAGWIGLALIAVALVVLAAASPGRPSTVHGELSDHQTTALGEGGTGMTHSGLQGGTTGPALRADPD